MRFLVDEMFSRDVVHQLRSGGHDVEHALDVGLAGRPDRDVLAYAARSDRLVVTENARDFVPLLDIATAGGAPVVAIVIALKRTLPKSAGLAAELARRLDAWAASTLSPTVTRTGSRGLPDMDGWCMASTSAPSVRSEMVTGAREPLLPRGGHRDVPEDVMSF